MHGVLCSKSEQRPHLRATDESSEGQENLSASLDLPGMYHAVKTDSVLLDKFFTTGLLGRSRQITISFDQNNLKAGWTPFLELIEMLKFCLTFQSRQNFFRSHN